jgi:hypothetical protein
VTSVSRREDAEDEIAWRWTADGQYTTQSAYRIQFVGRRKKPSLIPIWKAKVEPKCQIFAWILLQHKILTANNLAKCGWPHDPNCPLCHATPETPAHLCMECPFTQSVWSHSLTHLGRTVQSLPTSHSISAWWWRLRRPLPKKQKPAFDGFMMYFWWNIWKEHNRRVFQHRSLQATEVAKLIIDDTKLYQEARTIQRPTATTTTMAAP